MKIRTLIVDDELLGRRLIRRLLASEGSFPVIGECSDGNDAVEAICAERPDVVFLDIQMPELDGFGVLQSLPKAAMPIVVFVTAHDTFALKAFEARGLDYLLKPFDEERFYSALERVKAYFAGKQSSSVRRQIAELAGDVPPRAKFISRLMVKKDGGIVILKVPEIDSIGSVGNYLKVKVGNASYLLRGRIGELEKKLDPETFFRVHRSTIVNLDRVREFKPSFQGDATIVMSDGGRLSASREYRKKLQRSLGSAL